MLTWCMSYVEDNMDRAVSEVKALSEYNVWEK